MNALSYDKGFKSHRKSGCLPVCEQAALQRNWGKMQKYEQNITKHITIELGQ